MVVVVFLGELGGRLVVVGGDSGYSWWLLVVVMPMTDNGVHHNDNSNRNI